MLTRACVFSYNLYNFLCLYYGHVLPEPGTSQSPSSSVQLWIQWCGHTPWLRNTLHHCVVWALRKSLQLRRGWFVGMKVRGQWQKCRPLCGEWNRNLKLAKTQRRLTHDLPLTFNNSSSLPLTLTHTVIPPDAHTVTFIVPYPPSITHTANPSLRYLLAHCHSLKHSVTHTVTVSDTVKCTHCHSH